jgi:hypothetical protein
MRLELLAEIFPGAKFIHITRDPLMVVPFYEATWIMWLNAFESAVSPEEKVHPGQAHLPA